MFTRVPWASAGNPIPTTLDFKQVDISSSLNVIVNLIFSQEGMILSNEPGYYENGSFGIRIENLIRVVTAQTPNNFEKNTFLTFKTITLCPIQKKMIDPSLLTKSEIDHLNSYHEECKDKVRRRMCLTRNIIVKYVNLILIGWTSSPRNGPHRRTELAAQGNRAPWINLKYCLKSENHYFGGYKSE